MDIRKRLGELLMVGFEGDHMTAELAAHIRALQPAGLIFFKRNISSPEQLAQLTRDIQSLALKEFHRPLFLAVDQEGGSVARMGPPFTQLPDAASLGNRACEGVSSLLKLIAREMYLVGLNLNLAPVLDVSPMDSGGVMAYRSFGHDPSLVSLCGAAAIHAIQSENVMATAKHFPGLGRARKDPHYSLPVIPVSKDELEHNDLPPFRAALRANVACVMTCHTLYPALDPERPGTFSPVIIYDLLRNQLGFNGVVITDDLEMGAVGDQYSPRTAAVAALRAGVDLLLVCNELENMYQTATAVRNGLERGLLEPQSVELSLRRVENLRKTYLQPVNLADLSAVDTYFSS